MSDSQERINDQFASDVLACVDDLNKFIPKLALKYSDMVIVSALVEHTGGALRYHQGTGACSRDQALKMLAHAHDVAFPVRPPLNG